MSQSMKKNLTAVIAVILDDHGRTECMIKLDVNDVEMIALVADDPDPDPPTLPTVKPWPYRVFMKSGTSFYTDKRSGNVLEERWLNIR